MLLPFRDHTYFRLISTRTDETMFEAKLLRGSLLARTVVCDHSASTLLEVAVPPISDLEGSMETEQELPAGHGCPDFVCAVCGAALTDDDFFALGLRQPEPKETREEY